jgi:hypothetical protein
VKIWLRVNACGSLDGVFGGSRVDLVEVQDMWGLGWVFGWVRGRFG